MPTLLECKNHAHLAIGGYPSLAPGQTRSQRLVEIINQAGQHLFTWPWLFRERTTKTIDLVSGQGWVALPSDVEELLSVISTANNGNMVEITTPERMERLANFVAVSVGTVVSYACFSRPEPVDGDALGALRLDIYPVPTDDQEDALAVRYRARWVDIDSAADDDYEIPIPKEFDALFIAFVRAFAQAYEDEGLQQRLADIEIGPLFRRRQTKDGLQQGDLGQLRPGYNRTQQGLMYGDGYVSPPS